MEPDAQVWKGQGKGTFPGGKEVCASGDPRSRAQVPLESGLVYRQSLEHHTQDHRTVLLKCKC